MRRIAKDRSLTDDPKFLENDALLHSLVGASLAETLYGMTEQEFIKHATVLPPRDAKKAE